MTSIDIHLGHWNNHGVLSVGIHDEDVPAFEDHFMSAVACPGRRIELRAYRGKPTWGYKMIRNSTLSCKHYFPVCLTDPAHTRFPMFAVHDVRFEIEEDRDDGKVLSTDLAPDHLLPWPQMHGRHLTGQKSGFDVGKAASEQLTSRIRSAIAHAYCTKRVVKETPDWVRKALLPEQWVAAVSASGLKA